MSRNLALVAVLGCAMLFTGCGEAPLKFGDKITVTAGPNSKTAPNWRICKTPELEETVANAGFNELMALIQSESFQDIGGSQVAIYRSETPTHIEIEVTATGAGNGNKTHVGFVNKSTVVIARVK